MSQWTKQMTKAFMDGWNGNEEDDKPFKEIIAETKEDMDFLTGFYADEPEERKPKIIPAWEEKTKPTTYSPTNYNSKSSASLWNNQNSYNSAKQNPNTGTGDGLSRNTALGDTVPTANTAQPKTKSIWDNLTAGAGYALSGGSSLRNEPQKANNYTLKYMNSEPKMTSFLNTKQTAQPKPQSQGVLQSLGTGAGYHNSGGMSANWDRNGSLDLSGTRKAAERIGNTLEKYTPQISNGIYAGNYWGATSTQSPMESLDRIFKNAKEVANEHDKALVNAGLGAVTGINNGITNPQSIEYGIKALLNSLNDNDSVLSKRIQDANNGVFTGQHLADYNTDNWDWDALKYLGIRDVEGGLRPLENFADVWLMNMDIAKPVSAGLSFGNNGDYNTVLAQNRLISNEEEARYARETSITDPLMQQANSYESAKYLGEIGDTVSNLGEFTTRLLLGRIPILDPALSLSGYYAAGLNNAFSQGLSTEQAKAMALSQMYHQWLGAYHWRLFGTLLGTDHRPHDCTL